MSVIIAIDPGNVQSAMVKYDTESKLPTFIALEPNAKIMEYLAGSPEKRLAIEMIASYGMSVGATTFDTCLWIGRFVQQHVADMGEYRLLYRREEKIHLCGTMKAKDPNISQAIMDRYGSDRRIAVGTMKKPGPLYGFKEDIWAAMAVAITAAETEGIWVNT